MQTEKYALVNGRLYGNAGLKGAQELGVIIEDGKILDVVPVGQLPRDIQQCDMQGNIVAPGFIDLLVNGAGGGSFGVTANFDDLKLMGESMLAEGTTGFLAAAPSNTLEMYLAMQESLATHQTQCPVNLLGMHLEGPYFSLEYRGAHREDCVRDCTDEELKALFDKPNHFVSLMSVSPEKINDAQLKYLADKGIRISFAHSAAGYEETVSFLQKPNRSVTHLYNGMPQMHHRKPGHIPAIFHVKPLTGIIVDGTHVAYPMVRMAYEMMPEALYLFTDRFTPCPAWGVSYDEEADCCVRTTAEGRKILCGSALSMIKAVRNSVKQVGIPMEEALEMASYRPAKVLGIDNLYGRLAKNYVANLVVFDDNFQVKHVMIKGEWL